MARQRPTVSVLDPAGELAAVIGASDGMGCTSPPTWPLAAPR